MSPEIVCFFDDKTNSASYVVHDPETMQAAVIDPVLDYDPVSGRSSTESVEKIAAYVDEKGLAVAWIIETHVHADHLTASGLAEKRDRRKIRHRPGYYRGAENLRRAV
jgi:glyoxylase-like metal-dependent hydrolase (beta-lactamase superfamily II)